MSLSGLKDVDREILKHMDDKDLLRICSVDRKSWNEVCDDNFLRRRLGKYPGIEKYKRENESWKEFFLQVIYYVAKLKENFKYDYKSGDFRKQYEIFSLLTACKPKYIYAEGLPPMPLPSELHVAECAPFLLNKYFLDKLLLSAVGYGEIDLIKHAVENGANLQNEDLLPYAIERRQLEAIKYLIDMGINTKYSLRLAKDRETAQYLSNYINYTMDEKNDALLKATMDGNLEVVKWLVENGADIHVDNDKPLDNAINYARDLDIVKYLVEKGADIHAQDDQALKSAFFEFDLEIVKYLVEQQGARVNVLNEHLGEAVVNGELDLIKYLVAHGADIHAEDERLLMVAAEFGELEIVRFLIGRGARKIKKALKAAERGRRKNKKGQHDKVIKYLKSLLK